MRRMPIRHRLLAFPLGRCLPRDYAVLVGISPGYPPVAGRLHTCYSPVRRSPAAFSKLTAPLPLDLHVLSLSLAFILSQDQTLRCCISCLFFFLVLRPWRFAPDFSGPLPPRYTRIALIRSDALYCSLLFLYLFRIFKISSGNRRKLLF